MEFGEFLAAELPALSRFAGVLTGDRQDAHDVLTDALLVVAARWDRIGEMEHPTAYVRRVVTTTFLAARRTATRRRTSPTDDPARMARGSVDPVTRVDDRDEVARLIENLPTKQKVAVVLRYYLDLDDLTIADAMACRPGTVRSLLSRALATLRIAVSSSTLEDDR